MKEFPNGSKNKWTRILQKKWFFPSVYLLLAAFLLTGVVWYQNFESKLMEGMDDSSELSDIDAANPFDDEEAESVVQQQETIKMPVTEDMQAEIVTKFFDYNDEQEEQEKGLNLYNNRYYQSTGIDIAADDGETFDVVASLSGTVEEIKEDPLLGNIVIMSHEKDVSTYYASLGEVDVKEGAKVSQGDKLGIAGKNLFSEESGNHVHFELRKDEVQVNPEDFFNESIATLIDFEPAEVEDEAIEEEQEAPELDAEDEEDAESDTEEEDEEDEADSEEDALRDVSFYMTT